ncbi:unnamed protein product [Brachionus calyciflorus]|uniref:Major facilitator superfamily (MFS) profile domain-containing protein n=1 Tax=Brachionus calyciflorus TaxID=104777 RepID=A0A813S9Z1_9BILA|nr:unnamed protein product [Brachionus calyciflorus]
MDELFELINPYGRFQKLIMSLIGFSSILAAMTIYSTIFITATPKMSCISRANLTYLDPCVLIDPNLNEFQLNTTIYECTLDTIHYGSTIISEYSLWCEKKLYASLTQTFYMIGTFASILIGYFSDRFGRKKTIIVINFLLTFFLTFNQITHLNQFALNVKLRYIIYSITQFLSGFLSNGLYVVTYVLLMEITIPKFKTKMTNINSYWYISGELIVLIIAYVSRDWRLINWFICVYSFIVLILLIIFLPESPRYLIQSKQIVKANDLIDQMARVNQVKNFNVYTQADFLVKFIDKTKVKKENIFKIISNDKKILLNSFLLGFVWLSLALVYYGIGLGITNFNFINPYLMYFFSSLSELLGCLLAYLSDYFKRKRTFCALTLIASVNCFLVAFIPNDESSHLTLMHSFKIFFTIVGKAFVTASSICAYVYTTAMFPTEIRGTLFLFVSSLGKIGSVVSPLINYAGELIWKPLAYILFACCSFLGCLIIGLLQDPEKLNLN